ncbi:hypothetical protein J2Z21_003114 [Streptomyces griseochromogenes]|uniref:Uncharacterized protein n=1 Tax=Streptomyces griseochromogenes TaxID=68214 RepID=A0ABS4LRZ3_9ACTN|nr:hypothetical protein [Streptomyces griseochromogenes]MBP2050178.1 hypothetical protein [Streptomyces griseochromogenes]
MPADPLDTGCHHRGRHLWLTGDKDTPHVRTADGAEAWPRAKRGVACR